VVDAHSIYMDWVECLSFQFSSPFRFLLRYPFQNQKSEKLIISDPIFILKELVSWIWWLSVVSTLFYVVFFAVGPGSIPWMITAELFAQGPRPAAMSIAVLINW